MLPVKEYNVGDVVQIVPEPYLDCPFKWVEDMDNFCCCTAEIIGKHYYKNKEQYGYRIDIDREGWLWCAGCFVSTDEETEDISDEEFDAIIRF